MDSRMASSNLLSSEFNTKVPKSAGHPVNCCSCAIVSLVQGQPLTGSLEMIQFCLHICTASSPFSLSMACSALS